MRKNKESFPFFLFWSINPFLIIIYIIYNHTYITYIGETGRDLNVTYIGETVRDLNVRLTEHRQATRNGDLNNNIAEHHLQTNNRIDWDSAQYGIYFLPTSRQYNVVLPSQNRN